MTTARFLRWGLRLVWLALPLAAGPAMASLLAGHSVAVRAAGEVMLWAGWAIVLLATLIPYPVPLTTLRVGAAAGVAVAILAVGAGTGSTGARVGAVVATMVAALLAFSPEIGAQWVDGPSYPDEHRFPLRVPGTLLLGPVPLAWALSVGPPVAGVLLLASRRWVIGAITVVLGSALAAALLRSLHTLSRRWVVFVPAGVVLHDELSLTDPVLFQKKVIERLRPAPAGTDSLDLTQRSLGLALELILFEKVEMARTKPGRRGGDPGASARLLFTPTRPGAVLREAAGRGIPVG